MKKYLLILKNHKILIYSLFFILILFYVVNRFYIGQLETKKNTMLVEKENLTKQKNELLNAISNLKKENQILDQEKITLKDILIFKTKILDLKNKAIFLNQISNYHEVVLESIVTSDIVKSSPTLSKWTINITVKGTYNQIKNYMDYLNKLPYLINIVRLELNKQSQRQINTAQITMEVLCR